MNPSLWSRSSLLIVCFNLHHILISRRLRPFSLFFPGSILQSAASLSLLLSLTTLLSSSLRGSIPLFAATRSVTRFISSWIIFPSQHDVDVHNLYVTTSFNPVTIFIHDTAMKVETAVLLGASAINVGHAIAQECPAGSSPSISYVTVTYTPEPEPTPSPTDACPAGYSPVVSYITVTNTEDPVTTIASTSSEVPSTTIAPTTSDEPTTTITSTGTKTATITVTAGASASPVNAVEAKVQVQSSSYSSTAVAAASPKATTPAGSSSTTLGSSVSGQATFYGGNVSGGTCSFTDYTLPSGVFGTALSGANWDTSGNCGACVSVTGPSGKSITAMVSDC